MLEGYGTYIPAKTALNFKTNDKRDNGDMQGKHHTLPMSGHKKAGKWGLSCRGFNWAMRCLTYRNPLQDNSLCFALHGNYGRNVVKTQAFRDLDVAVE